MGVGLIGVGVVCASNVCVFVGGRERAREMMKAKFFFFLLGRVMDINTSKKEWWGGGDVG